MKDRIKKYIEYKGISAGDLATMLDVQRSNISHILNGRNKPGAVFIEKLLLTFTDLNARWLLTGHGEMTNEIEEAKIDKTKQIPFQAEEIKEIVPQTNTSESVIIPEPKVDEASEIQNPALNEDKVQKMILIYDDGTFSTLKNRVK